MTAPMKWFNPRTPRRSAGSARRMAAAAMEPAPRPSPKAVAQDDSSEAPLQAAGASPAPVPTREPR